MNYIGVDLGTSALKLLLVDEHGGKIKELSREYPIYFPHSGWSEQNPKDWLDAVISGLKEMLEDQDPATIGAISFAGQMHGLVILDDKDQVIRPAILWNDGRCEDECQRLNEGLGLDALIDNTGNIAFAGFTAPKLLWLREHERENYDRISKVMLPKDYLVYTLSGVHATDVSDASGMLLFDVKNRKWSETMLEIVGLKEEQMAKVYESYQSVGYVKKTISDMTGLSTSTKVVVGAGDNAAAAVGTGVVREGDMNLSLGTSGTLFIASDNYLRDSSGAMHSFCHANGKNHLMGCILSAASCNKWWMDKILETSDYGAEQARIADEHLADNKVFFLPYLMGERTPHNDTDARAAFLGMSMDTTREEMTLAVLEGVAFALRDCLELAKKDGASPTSSMISGGGVKSELWLKIVANVLHMKLTVPEISEGPSLGAAILAAVGNKEYRSVEEAAKKIVGVSRTIEPDPELEAKYDEKYKVYKAIYPALKDLYKSMK